jgi:hypothetical protein
MAMDKDQSIITQVAAKIAADLAIHNIETEAFTLKFMDVKEILFDMIYGAQPVASVADAIVTAFPGASEQAFTVAVKNEQQGPLPAWLIDACRKDGITEVYDNRGDLAANPRRPWFKAVKDKEKAYWPPKGA